MTTIMTTPPMIAELYPNVGRILLFVAFEEANAKSESNYQQIIFTAETEAVFRLDCSRDACAGGGFDFAPVIDTMMKNGEARVQGTLACTGIVATDGYTCGLKAEYRIIIE